MLISAVTAAPERVPVYLELAGEEHPIPVYPLAPGSGHQPFTVRVASPHLADPEPEPPRKPTSQVPSPFEPPRSGEKFSAADAGVSSDPAGSRPARLPTSVSNSLGAGFFESGADFGRSPPQFPSFDTAFEAARSRRRGARRLFPPAEVSGVTPEVSEVTNQLSHEPDSGHTDSEVSM